MGRWKRPLHYLGRCGRHCLAYEHRIGVLKGTFISITPNSIMVSDVAQPILQRGCHCQCDAMQPARWKKAIESGHLCVEEPGLVGYDHAMAVYRVL